MGNNLFVMVSGPAASGKTTLIQKMGVCLPMYFYKPSNAYFDIAKQRRIDVSLAFDKIMEEDAQNYFCNICKAHEITIGDQHLAIQPNKDSAIASGRIVDGMFENEPYAPGINYSLFEKLSESDIKTLLIYLKASPEVLFERAYQRNLDTGMYIRNKTLREVEDEVAAEWYYYNGLMKQVDIESLVMDTDALSREDVLRNSMEKTLKLSRKLFDHE